MPIREIKDNSVKRILGTHELFVEFLRDYIPIDILKNVQPEDIEDLSERFLPLFQEHRDSDTIKRITLPGKTPVFVIAVVEHESQVNFRASFKMFQYICLVLDAYEKEEDARRRGISRTKDFRYPPVLPVVFYDGRQKWTALRNFREKTNLYEAFAKYIPSFEYELVDLSTYRIEDITQFKDALSFIMLIDRLRDRAGLKLLEKLPSDYFTGLKIPQNLYKLLEDVTTVLLSRLEVPAEEIAGITDFIEKRDYQMMFDSLVESVKKDKRLAVRRARTELRARINDLRQQLEVKEEQLAALKRENEALRKKNKS
jgi:hypothetical protein